MSLSPWTGVFDVEFWIVMFHSGSSLRKNCTKWSRTLSELAVPGTRGIRIGDRIGPLLISKSLVSGRGKWYFSVSSERAEYALPGMNLDANSVRVAVTLQSCMASSTKRGLITLLRIRTCRKQRGNAAGGGELG